MDISYLVSILRERGYDIRGTAHTAGVSERNLPEGNFIYVDGHHPELEIYGHIHLIKGAWQNPETEITIVPSEVFLG